MHAVARSAAWGKRARGAAHAAQKNWAGCAWHPAQWNLGDPTGSRSRADQVSGLKGGGAARNTRRAPQGGGAVPDSRCRSSNNGLMPDSYLIEQSFMLQCSYAADAWLRGGCCGSSRASGGQAAGLHNLFGAGVSGMSGTGWLAACPLCSPCQASHRQKASQHSNGRCNSGKGQQAV